MHENVLETRELILQAKKGKKDAQDLLLQRVSPVLTGLIRRKLGKEARLFMETGDVLDEALMDLIRGLPSFRGDSLEDILRYLHRIFQNKIRDKVKEEKAKKRDFRRRVPLSQTGRTSEAGIVVQSREPSPSQVLLKKELEERFRKAEAQLSPKERELIRLRKDWGATPTEMARLLGFNSPDAARMALARSLSKLSSLLLE